MYAHSLAQSAYGQAVIGLKSPRSAEYEVFAQITSRLCRAAQDPSGFVDLVSALSDNRRLWTELASDVAQPENGLPIEIRVGILNLAQFTLRHTAQVLNDNADPGPLIDINRAMMKGLSGNGGAA